MDFKPHKTKIAFYTSDLGIGGIQRSIVSLLNSIDFNKYEVDLHLLRMDGALFSKIPEDVNVKKLRTVPVCAKFIPFWLSYRLFGARYRVEGYDAAIDFNGYQPATAIAALRTNAPCAITWIHGNYMERIKSDIKFRLLFLSTKEKYKQFDRVAVVSAGLVGDVSKMGRIEKNKIVTINNILDVDSMKARSEEPADTEVDTKLYNIASVCRLIKQKGVDETLRIFAKARNSNKKMKLYVIGDGPEMASLKLLANQLELDESVVFMGQQSNPYTILKMMDGYISTSWHEGQGISTLEAKYFGLDIFIPKRLEEYSYEVAGTDDLVEAILVSSAGKKRQKNIDDLKRYNATILERFDVLVTGCE